MITRLDKLEATRFLKVFLAGKPKSAGKTTLALTAPGEKLLFSFDLGNPPIPPGVDPTTVWVRQYAPSAPGVKVDSDQWIRSVNVGSQIITDLDEVRSAFLGGRPIVLDGQVVPLPQSLILDGLTEWQAITLDWVLGVNRKTDPEDFANRYTAWGKRLHIMRTLLNMTVPLPCNVTLIAWEVAELTPDGKPTGKIIPDVGGRLDNMTPGKVDAALRCFAKFQEGKTRFFVQTKPDGIRDWLGVRGAYGGESEIEVTVTGPRKPGAPTPWEQVFGRR